MKKVFFAVVVFVGFSNLSLYSDRYLSVLDSSDCNWEKLDRATEESAISGFQVNGKPEWESFNQWQCFPSDGIETQCATAEYDGGLRKVPLIHVWHAFHLYEFSMESDPEPDCDRVIDRWKTLLADEESFCVYAAYLQQVDYVATGSASDESVWIMNRLKTRKGYWSFDADENYIQESDLDDDQSMSDSSLTH